MTSVKKTVATTLAVVAMLTAPLAAQSLPAQNEAILSELKAIRQLLEKLTSSPPNARDSTVKLADITGYMIGRPDAPLTMVEFTDLQCPFCRQFHATTFEQLKKDYIDTGKLRYISRDFPLSTIHPFALAAARATRCAGDQGQFWEMRHTIMVNNGALRDDVFVTFAQDLKLDASAFKSCVNDSGKYQAEIQRELADGTNAGITGTPSFIIGRTSATGLDGLRIVGNQPYVTFDAKLKELLIKP